MLVVTHSWRNGFQNARGLWLSSGTICPGHVDFPENLIATLATGPGQGCISWYAADQRLWLTMWPSMTRRSMWHEGTGGPGAVVLGRLPVGYSCLMVFQAFHGGRMDLVSARKFSGRGLVSARISLPFVFRGDR